MAGIWIGDKEMPSGFNFTHADKGLFRLVKVRKIHRCRRCDNNIYNGSWCAGDGWRRICFKCLPKFLEDIEKNFKENIKVIKNLQEKIKLNQSRYGDDNVLANLRAENGMQ